MLPRDKSLNKRVKYARHAVAIDDERQTFFPLLWDEDSEKEKENNRKFLHPPDRIKQVWFAGMHSNVGGGYADDALSMGPLCWMAGEAAAHGIAISTTPAAVRRSGSDEWLEKAAPCAPMGDSRKGVAAYYRYHPRPIGRLCGLKDHSSERDPKSAVTIDRPKIHESVFERIRDARDSYAPFGLPENYVGRHQEGAGTGGRCRPGQSNAKSVRTFHAGRVPRARTGEHMGHRVAAACRLFCDGVRYAVPARLAVVSPGVGAGG
jgi:hypothetical protein